MSITRRITFLLFIIAAIAILPWLGSWIRHNGVFPADFFNYPPSTPPAYTAPFSWTVFIITAIVFGGSMGCLYFFPSLFGFKKMPLPPKKEMPKVNLPIWFWAGLVLWGTTTLLFLTKSKEPLWLLHWADLPIYWGFVLMIDGWVYVRNGGRSLVSLVPQEIIGIGVASIPGWMLFEYLNFFVDNYWYYPYAGLMGRQEILLYAIFTSSVLMPLCFEWYCLFNTYPAFKQRFSFGAKIIMTEGLKTILLIMGLALLFATGLFPETMFITLWVAPPIVLAAALDKIGVWTPLRSIGKGNWSPTLLFALTYLLEGFLLECQNYFTVNHGSNAMDYVVAPLYWKYCIPYVDTLHIFEMPIIGFLGYLPFGVYCWVWWIACAILLNIPSRFFKEDPLEDNL